MLGDRLSKGTAQCGPGPACTRARIDAASDGVNRRAAGLMTRLAHSILPLHAAIADIAYMPSSTSEACVSPGSIGKPTDAFHTHRKPVTESFNRKHMGVVRSDEREESILFLQPHTCLFTAFPRVNDNLPLVTVANEAN